MADKEWTVMILFAADNALSPLVVSQLKAIKDAGFHEDVDVLVHFDSNEVGVPTRIFDVNRRRKLRERVLIGDGRDSFVRNLREDDVRLEEINPAAGEASARLRAALENPDTVTAAQALRNFLGFCREHHRAKNYMLFLTGHGLVVGNDTFLPDDKPISAITLAELQKILKDFTDAIKEDKSEENETGGVLQLLALHSCAMSAIEVAYQLKGTARYMIGSEGVSYVNSWPYRQILKKILNFVDRAKGGSRQLHDDRDAEFEEEANNENANDPRDLIEKLYFHSLFNATDFMLSGYSLDLCLCNLDPQKFDSLTKVIAPLVIKLRRALESERGRELILLAHWESQSYWNESYTDLFDFCFCLRKRCRLALGLPNEYGSEETEEAVTELGDLAKSCTGVMAELDRKHSRKLEERFSKIIVHSCHFGSQYQYSHGLSIYFPWSRPLDDDPPANIPPELQQRQSEPGRNSQGILERYRRYTFNLDLWKEDKNATWIAFLESYFDSTQRKTRREEEEGAGIKGDEAGRFPISGFFNHFGGQSDNPFPALNKESPRVGESCACPSIKNYPTDTVTTRDGKQRNVSAVTVSNIVLRKLRQTE